MLFSFRPLDLMATRIQKICTQAVEVATTTHVLNANARAVPMAMFDCCLERPMSGENRPEGTAVP